MLRGGHSEGLGWRVMRLFNAGHGALDAPAARPSAAGDLETKQEYGMMVEKLSNVTMVNDGDDIFIEVNGAKIAKRGKPGTPQAGTWISLEPGWTVSDSGTHSLEIAHDGVPLQ